MEFDRCAEDVGNVLHLEHVNLQVPDPLIATQFYVGALGLTRDPYLMTGVDNMWINAGRTQFHLPTGPAQKLRGQIDLVIPDRQALLQRLQASLAALQHTEFGFEAGEGFVDVRCPWGNRLRCFEPEASRFAGIALGIARLEFEVAPGTSSRIARFYREALGARAQWHTDVRPGDVGPDTGQAVAEVQVGAGQLLLFRESASPHLPYDGHHIQIYVADFSGPHARLKALGAVSQESDQHQYRLLDIVDLDSGTPLFRLEHEVRSLTHPLFGRPLVNRNPAQNNRHYRRGHDAFED